MSKRNFAKLYMSASNLVISERAFGEIFLHEEGVFKMYEWLMGKDESTEYKIKYINMFKRTFYNLERNENGEWVDLLGSYDRVDTEAWMEKCRVEEPGIYRIREVKEEYAMLLTEISEIRMSDLPQDKEVVILNPEAFLDYTSRLESFRVQYATVGENGEVGGRECAYILTLEEDPMEDGVERRWDYLDICATEDDAEALIAELKREEEECRADKGGRYYDEKTAERCLNRRYYKREIKILH